MQFFKKIGAGVALVALLAGPADAFFYSTALKNARMDAITTDIGSAGRLKIYTAGGGAVACSGTLLADLALSTPAAPAASGGVLTFSSITADSSADATGTAACATITKSGGTVSVDGLTVGTSGTNIVLNSVSIISGGTVSMAGPNTLTHP
jgi:hypothetical protein